MKRKLLLTIIMAFVLVFTMAICASAANGSTSDEFGEVTVVDGLTSVMLDRDAKVVLKNANGTYSTYYTYYIYPKKAWNNAMKSPDFTALNNAVGEKYDNTSIIRIELLSDCDKYELPTECNTYLKELVFPDDLAITTLPRTYFNALEKVYIGASFTSAASNTLRDAVKLKTVVFSENCQLTEIPSGMFMGCTSLEEIKIPNCITSISSSAFRDATALKKVYLGENVVTTGDYFIDKASEVSIYASSKWFSTTTPATKSFGYTSLKSATLYYVGSYEQALALTQKATHTPIAKANLVKWDSTKEDSFYAPSAEDEVWTIVYDYNNCNAFYDGVHVPDPEKTSACADVCQNCDLVTLKENPEHSLLVVTEFKDYVTNGTRTTSCQNEGCPLHENAQVETLSPIFEILGFSTNSANTKMVAGYKFNADSYRESKKTLSYGVVAYVSNDASCNPLDVIEGAVAPKSSSNTICADLSGTQTSFDFILLGINGVSVSLAMCPYVYDGNVISYLNYENGALVQSESAYTYKIVNGELII